MFQINMVEGYSKKDSKKAGDKWLSCQYGFTPSADLIVSCVAFLTNQSQLDN